MCGSPQRKLADGVEIDVTGMKAVTLGYRNGDGSQSPGTALPFTVIDEMPQLGSQTSESFYDNAYQINTDDSFNFKETQQSQ